MWGVQINSICHPLHTHTRWKHSCDKRPKTQNIHDFRCYNMKPLWLPLWSRRTGNCAATLTIGSTSPIHKSSAPVCVETLNTQSKPQTALTTPTSPPATADWWGGKRLNMSRVTELRTKRQRNPNFTGKNWSDKIRNCALVAQNTNNINSNRIINRIKYLQIYSE